jgi:vancomycin resistance protein YoaR
MPPVARHGDTTSEWLWVLPSLAIPLVISATAWTSHVSSEGDEIAPNVHFAGIDLSGATPEEAAAHVGWRETAFLQTPVTIDLGEQVVTMTAEEIGFDYDYDRTVQAVVSARHRDNAWGEFVSWVSTPFSEETIEDVYRLDEEKAKSVLAGNDFILEQPVEPAVTMSDGALSLVPGEDGLAIDIEATIEELGSAGVAAGPVEIAAATAPLPPDVSDDEAMRTVRRLNEVTSDELVFALGLTTARLAPEEARRLFSSRVVDGEMEPVLDVDTLRADLEALFPEPQGEFVKPTVEVVDGQVSVAKPGIPPSVCCSEESVQKAAAEILAGGAPVYALETKPDDSPEAVAWANGSSVTEVVSEFTTRHPCCENRVINIQTMADAVRGYYMLPGETFSLNEYIGPRTREKGYVAAGAIRGGYMTDEVGGGVSQFTTTLFNAAFFAGLDLDVYQSHSVYFSRYPFGREATLSVPGPDLVLTNSTDHPILIWPTYDSTSITVTMYSTRNVEVEEIDQRLSYRGQCRHSEIDRQRTFSDGRVVVDTIVANYRPADGIDCRGNTIPRRDN